MYSDLDIFKLSSLIILILRKCINVLSRIVSDKDRLVSVIYLKIKKL